MMFFLPGLICGCAGAFAMARWGGRIGLMDLPEDRSSHVVPTPKGGGIGILAAFVLAAGFSCMAWPLILSAAVLSGVSLVGDIREVSRRFRLFVQAGCAWIWIWSLHPDLSPAWTGLAVLAVVYATNLYNFMDGINGLAAGTGAVGFGMMALLFPDAAGPLRPVALAVCGACLGFLPFNLSGRVFMGDTGSILLGFLFAQMAGIAADTLPRFAGAVALMMPFYMDGSLTLGLRLFQGENIFRPHRRHLYQLLANEMRIAHWKVAGMFVLVQALFGAFMVWLTRSGPAFCITLGTIPVAGLIFLSLRIRKTVAQAAEGKGPGPESGDKG